MNNSTPSDDINKDHINVSEQLSTESQMTIQDLQAEVEKNLLGWQKAQADYLNLQKEMDRERKSLIQFGNQKIIEKFIPLFDNFDVAFKNLPEALQGDTWIAGIQFIRSQMLQILTEEGVTVIDPVGEIFNPHEHEAVAMEQGEDESSEQKVLEVLQVGYKLHDKVIRSARVKVSL